MVGFAALVILLVDFGRLRPCARHVSLFQSCRLICLFPVFFHPHQKLCRLHFRKAIGRIVGFSRCRQSFDSHSIRLQ